MSCSPLHTVSLSDRVSEIVSEFIQLQHTPSPFSSPHLTSPLLTPPHLTPLLFTLICSYHHSNTNIPVHAISYIILPLTPYPYVQAPVRSPLPWPLLSQTDLNPWGRQHSRNKQVHTYSHCSVCTYVWIVLNITYDRTSEVILWIFFWRGKFVNNLRMGL